MFGESRLSPFLELSAGVKYMDAHLGTVYHRGSKSECTNQKTCLQGVKDGDPKSLAAKHSVRVSFPKILK